MNRRRTSHKGHGPRRRHATSPSSGKFSIGHPAVFLEFTAGLLPLPPKENRPRAAAEAAESQYERSAPPLPRARMIPRESARQRAQLARGALTNMERASGNPFKALYGSGRERGSLSFRTRLDNSVAAIPPASAGMNSTAVIAD